MPENTNIKIKEIAQQVRDDKEVSLSPRERVKGEGATLKNSEANMLPEKSLPCERGGRSPLLDSETTQSIKSHPKLDRLRCRDLEEQSPLLFPPLARGAKIAFTLAEVLITLSIIGIVAVLTIPNLIQNHNEKAWSTSKDLWQKKLVEATRQMNIDGVMTGVAGTTEDFMDDFKKYVKIIKTCDKSKLKNCYSPKIVQTAGDEVEVSDLTTSNRLGQKWNTNTMGLVIADGTTVIMAYNPNCDSVDPFSKEGQSGQVGCMSMIIDVNGKKGPNKVGKDIDLLNASISTSGCDLQLPGSDLCLAGSDIYPIKSINTCEGSEYHKYDERSDSDNIYCATNYWAGAKKACEDLGMHLATGDELAEIAAYIYEYDGSVSKNTKISKSPNADKASNLSWSTNGGYYWSSEPYGSYIAYLRSFSSYSSNWYYDTPVGNSNGHARCVSN